MSGKALVSGRLRKIDKAYLATEVDGELVMIDSETGKFFALKDVAFDIWRKLDSEPELDAICNSLEDEYGVEPERCRQSVAAFAQQLVELGFAERF